MSTTEPHTLAGGGRGEARLGPGTVRRYLTPTPAQRALGLVCLGSGRQEGAVRPIVDRALDCHAAVLVTSGSGVLDWGDPAQRLEFDAPLLFFLRPGLRHSYAPRQVWSERWVLFDGPAVQAYARLGCLPTNGPAVGLRDPIPVSRLLDRVVYACRSDLPYADLEAAALIHELLVTAQRYTVRAPARHSRATILAALQARACTDATVADHARELGLSVRELREAVRAGAGCSPKELLLRARLNEAKALLADSGAPIAQVARTVGYDDPAYFSRIFTRRVGLTPRAFRRQESRSISNSPSISN